MQRHLFHQLALWIHMHQYLITMAAPIIILLLVTVINLYDEPEIHKLNICDHRVVFNSQHHERCYVNT